MSTPNTPAEFQTHTGVSRETLEKYQIWHDLLVRWNRKINLVAPSTIGSFWTRHALDSHQIISLIPKDAKTLLDMGAGAGFPGLAIAINADPKTSEVTLVESNGKKCNFLRTAIRELGIPARVEQGRIQMLAPRPYDVITARAFAALTDLLAYALPYFSQSSTAIFPKGANWEHEVLEAQKVYRFDVSTYPSQTDPDARILRITNLQEK